jgi:5'(3')-deoxyribonucleotidase
MVMGLRIGVDIDGVLRDWDTAVIEMIRKHYPDKLIVGKRVSDSLNHIDIPVEILRFLFSVKHVNEVYLDALPYSTAIVDFGMFRTFAKLSGHTLVCVSHQWDDTLLATLQWLGKYGFGFQELIFTGNKYEANVDYLIDDFPKHYAAWVEHERQENKFILFNRPYNQDCSATNRITTLVDAIRLIR